MKFLCDQCKAKYQIADEKVAGKTVRMKCRKCGHMIEVKSEVTETSVASAMPRDDATQAGTPAAPMMNVTPGRPAGAPRPGAPAAPAAPRPAASKLATNLANTRPSPVSKPPGATRPESALAGAFQKSVQKDEALHQIATNAEWYVAINGVPVGPIRLTELRRKAASGAVTDDSLCWQDGMEEWRPLRSVTELSAIVHEALAGARPSLASPSPVDSHPSLTPAPPARVEPSRPLAPQGPRGTPGPGRVEPSKPLAPAARSNVVSLSSRLATAERLDVDEHPEDHTVVGDPFAALAPAPSSSALPLVSPAATTSQPIAPVAAPPFHFTEPPVQKKAPNWIAIAMIVLAGAFGITAAIALFVRPAAPVAPAATVIVPAATAPVPTTPTTDTAVATAEPTATATASTPGVAVAANPGGGGGGTRPVATATAKPAGGAGDIASLLGGPTSGPNVGGGGGGGGGGGAALSQSSIENVVRSRTPGVKRTCWERGGGTEANVNVTVKLVIAASGAVSSASATGNDPIVTKCIESQTRSWQFPASNGSTNVDIPFHFLRQ